jgi:hypothetical protein
MKQLVTPTLANRRQDLVHHKGKKKRVKYIDQIEEEEEDEDSDDNTIDPSACHHGDDDSHGDGGGDVGSYVAGGVVRGGRG